MRGIGAPIEIHRRSQLVDFAKDSANWHKYAVSLAQKENGSRFHGAACDTKRTLIPSWTY
jgi:hypothetical protein